MLRSVKISGTMKSSQKRPPHSYAKQRWERVRITEITLVFSPSPSMVFGRTNLAGIHRCHPIVWTTTHACFKFARTLCYLPNRTRKQQTRVCRSTIPTSRRLRAVVVLRRTVSTYVRASRLGCQTFRFQTILNVSISDISISDISISDISISDISDLRHFDSYEFLVMGRAPCALRVGLIL